MATVRQPVSIDGITFDALLDESQPFEADVPVYPVEKGYEVSDSIILKARTLSMTLYLTNTPVTWSALHGISQTRVRDVTRLLKEKYFAKKPVTVMTGEETFRNMAIVSFELTKSLETGTSREIPITFQEIRVTESTTTTIPDGYGMTGVNAGTASTTAKPAPAAPESGSKGSILYSLANATGLLGGGGSLGGLLG